MKSAREIADRLRDKNLSREEREFLKSLLDTGKALGRSLDLLSRIQRVKVSNTLTNNDKINYAKRSLGKVKERLDQAYGEFSGKLDVDEEIQSIMEDLDFINRELSNIDSSTQNIRNANKSIRNALSSLNKSEKDKDRLDVKSISKALMSTMSRLESIERDQSRENPSKPLRQAVGELSSLRGIGNFIQAIPSRVKRLKKK